MKTFNQINPTVIGDGGAPSRPKKQKIIGLLAIILASCCLTASAQTHQSRSFLTGYSLQITKNSTNLWNGNNTYAKGYTLTNSTVYPYTSSVSPIFATGTNAFADVALWADRDGTTPSVSITAQISSPYPGFTNVATFRFATVPVGARSANYPPGLYTSSTAAQNLWSFSVTGTGGNLLSITTNVPAALLQGCAGLRCTSVEWTGNGTNGALDGLFLNGFTPD